MRLNEEEFWDLTPKMFLELCKRRNVGIKYQRYAAAMTASAVYNVNRASSDDPLVEPFDFIRSQEGAEKKERRIKAKRHVQSALTLPFGTSREKYLEIRVKVIEDLKASGYTDAIEIVNECFPTLKATEGIEITPEVETEQIQVPLVGHKPTRVNAISGEQSPLMQNKRGLR